MEYANITCWVVVSVSSGNVIDVFGSREDAREFVRDSRVGEDFDADAENWRVRKAEARIVG